MAIRKVGKVYHAYFRNEDGKQVERSLMTGDITVARKREAVLLSARNLRKFCKRNRLDLTADIAETVSVPERNRIRLAQLPEIAQKRKQLHPRTIRTWNVFADAMAKEYHIHFAEDVTPRLALAYLEAHFSGGNGKTFNNVKSALNSVFKRCLVEIGCDSSPFAPIANRTVTEVDSHRNLTDAEIESVLPHLPEAVRCAVMLSRWTTQRLETVCRMTPQMFDWNKGAFVIMPSKTARFNKLVVCPILPPLRTYLEPLLSGLEPDSPIVGQLADGKQYSPHYISKVFNRTLKAVGIEDSVLGKASFHSIRGTAITWYKENGFSSDVLRRITGHTTTAVEDIYARDIAPVLQAAAKLFQQ